MENGLCLKAEGLGIMRGERVLFREFSLEVEAGEAVLLRGANGTGKTTLLRCFAGLARPDTGTCKHVSFYWLGHRVGVKPHESPRMHLSTWAQAFGADLAQIDTTLNLMGLTRAQDVSGAQLSVGQRKRTALCRMQLAARPLWLLDEPFSALDTEGKSLLMDLIARHRDVGGALIAAVHGDVALPGAREVQL